MQIKRFEAQTMTDALKKIKREFGPDAVILSAKSLKQEKGIFGFVSRPKVEVTAATDRLPVAEPKAKGIPGGYKSDQEKSEMIHEEEVEKTSSEPVWTKSSATKYEICEANTEEPPLAENKKELFQIHQKMISQGVNEDIVSDVIGGVDRIALSRACSGRGQMRECLIRTLERMGVFTETMRLNPSKQKIAAFVGPAGVGKTTTIAKLASIHAVDMGRQVALITLDDYRIAAVEQLKVYAKIIGVPVIVASSKEALREALRRLPLYDLILIDTAGISTNNTAKLNELKEALENIPNLETHLLLDASTREKDLARIIDRFRTIPINRLLFTKLDETGSYGVILNQMIRTKLPLSYLTDGQSVPENMILPNLPSLVDLLLEDWKEQRGRPEGQRVEEDMESDGGERQISLNAPFIANRDMDVFHTLDCHWAKKIHAENMIVFETIEEGAKQGYDPCRLCNPAGDDYPESGHMNIENTYYSDHQHWNSK